MIDILACDGTYRLFPEPWKDLVRQVPAIGRERSRFPVSGMTAEDFHHNVLEWDLRGLDSSGGRLTLPEGGQMRPGKRAGFGHWHRACIADRRPLASPVALGVNEKPHSTGRQDPDAKPLKVDVAVIAGGLAGFECVDSTLGQATIGHGVSPESVALANPKKADCLFPVLDTGKK